jgi:hypothetical protein
MLQELKDYLIHARECVSGYPLSPLELELQLQLHLFSK